MNSLNHGPAKTELELPNSVIFSLILHDHQYNIKYTVDAYKKTPKELLLRGLKVLPVGCLPLPEL